MELPPQVCSFQAVYLRAKVSVTCPDWPSLSKKKKKKKICCKITSTLHCFWTVLEDCVFKVPFPQLKTREPQSPLPSTAFICIVPLLRMWKIVWTHLRSSVCTARGSTCLQRSEEGFQCVVNHSAEVRFVANCDWLFTVYFVRRSLLNLVCHLIGSARPLCGSLTDVLSNVVLTNHENMTWKKIHVVDKIPLINLCNLLNTIKHKHLKNIQQI